MKFASVQGPSAISYEGCAAKCASIASCRAIDYEYKVNRCNYILETITAASYDAVTAGQGSHKIYELVCFNIVDPCRPGRPIPTGPDDYETTDSGSVKPTSTPARGPAAISSVAAVVSPAHSAAPSLSPCPVSVSSFTVHVTGGTGW